MFVEKSIGIKIIVDISIVDPLVKLWLLQISSPTKFPT